MKRLAGLTFAVACALVVVAVLGVDVRAYRVAAPIVLAFGVAGALQVASPRYRRLYPMVVGGAIITVTVAVVERSSQPQLDSDFAIGQIVGFGGLWVTVLWYLGFFERGAARRELLDVAAVTAGIAAGTAAAFRTLWSSTLSDAQALAVGNVVLNAAGIAVAVVFIGAEVHWNAAARWLLAGLTINLAGNVGFIGAYERGIDKAPLETAWLIGFAMMAVGLWHHDMGRLECRRRTTATTRRTVALAAITVATCGGGAALIAADGERILLAFGMVAVLAAGARAMAAVQQAGHDRSALELALQRERRARDDERESLKALMHGDVVQMLAAATWLEDHGDARAIVLLAERRTRAILDGLRPRVPLFSEYAAALGEVLQPFGGATRWKVTSPAYGAHDTVWALVREAATNVAKHAGATEACVAVERVADRYVVTVSDDGVGFINQTSRMGWRNVRAAVDDIGGSVRVETATTGGTTVRAEIPA